MMKNRQKLEHLEKQMEENLLQLKDLFGEIFHSSVENESGQTLENLKLANFDLFFWKKVPLKKEAPR